jgi:hypothetical protein
MQGYRRSKALIAFVLLIVPAILGIGASAQEPAPKAKPEDVGSIDAIVKALYDVISGPQGKARDWDRFRALCAPGARLIPAAPLKGGGAKAVVNTPEEYIEKATPAFEKTGFFESEIARRVEAFGNIAHVWSTYESRHAEGEAPFVRGINSIGLLRDGERWRIVTVFWSSETPESPIPPEYLPNAME